MNYASIASSAAVSVPTSFVAASTVQAPEKGSAKSSTKVSSRKKDDARMEKSTYFGEFPRLASRGDGFPRSPPRNSFALAKTPSKRVRLRDASSSTLV